MSTIKVDTVRPVTADASLTLQGDNSGTGVSGITIDSSGNATFAQTISGGTIGSGVTFPAGHILQVQYTQFTSTAEMTSISASTDYVISDGTAGSGTEILNVDITPISASSKIWIQVQWVGQIDPAVSYNVIFFLFRDATKLSHAPSGSRNVGIAPMGISLDGGTSAEPQSAFFQYFDTPSTTSQITYKVGFKTPATSVTLYTNRTVTDTTDNAFRERGISSISAMEIAG